MSGAVWFLLGAFVGFDVTLAYAWLAARRLNRRRELRWRIGAYTGRPW